MNYDSGLKYVPVVHNWLATCDGVKQVECQLPTTDCTLMNVVFDPGAEVPRHFHAAQRETIFVVQGEILDKDTGITTGTHGTYTIPAGRPHTIYSKTGALLNVLFIPKFVGGPKAYVEKSVVQDTIAA